MKKHVSFKIGGPADILIIPDKVSQVKNLINYFKANDIPYITIGNGSNLLVNDDGIRKAVLKIGNEMESIELADENQIIASAGTSLFKLSYFAMQNSLSGIEFLWGIPGNVGGAVFMNAGAYGGEIKDVIVSSRYIDLDGNEGMFTQDEMMLEYRSSIYHNNNYIIISAKFKLEKGCSIQIKNKMDELMQKRKQKQPLQYPNAGSVFKRPEGNYVGSLIEKAGLKGFSIGGAQVSEKHAGFIVNKDNATAKDVLDLINYIQKQVYAKTGYNLKTEIKII